ncbi:MAG TPA: urease accessory protein UreD [Solirubrobacteraceae bacterium]|nr:urease accessory protein UreD [Solirubrobacteraceae bacterium]
MFALLRGGDLLRARPLPPAGTTARVALVQASASLLSGDRLELDVVLGAGAAVELVEVAAMVAQPTRGGPAARLAIAATLGAGARLHWDARPLVLTAGCDLRRRIDVRLGRGAVAVLRDTLVFGRTGEEPGRLASRTTAEVGGVALHDEGLDTGDLATLRSPAVVGGARVLDVVALYGDRGEAPGALQLAGPGTLAVVCAPDAAQAHALIDPIRRRWARALLDGAGRGDDLQAGVEGRATLAPSATGQSVPSL